MKKIIFFCAAVILSWSATLAMASNQQVIKIITSLPVGSGPDNLLRKLSQNLEPVWNAKIIIDNRPGGNGLVALRAYQADTSPTTLFFGDSSNFTTLPLLLNQSSVLNDLEPLAPVTMAEMMLFTSPSVKNFADLKKELQRPHSYGSWGVGSPAHFNALLLLEAMNLSSQGVHVPYKDYGIWFTDTSNKNLLFGFATPGSAGKLEQGGKLRFLGITGTKKHATWPNVVTVSELINKNIDFIQPWVAFYIKKNVDPSVKAKMSQDIKKALDDPEFRQFMISMNYDHWDISNADFKKYTETQSILYKKIIDKFKIRIE